MTQTADATAATPQPLFTRDRTYHRQADLHAVYGGQRQGGISTPAQYPMIFLFSGEAGEQYGYHDNFQADGTFWYTGEGQIGDMTMIRGNKAIRDHHENQETLHLFEYIAKGEVRYLGEAFYLGHHLETRPDRDGKLRQAIVFELDISGTSSATTSSETPTTIVATSDLRSLSSSELKAIAIRPPARTATASERRVVVLNRSAAIREYVLRRADGTCECCGEAAPFSTKKGRPYLEPHHILRLTDGGPEDPRWIAAVCPNCHREIHYGK